MSSSSADPVDAARGRTAPIGGLMNWWRHSLLLRLTVVQALAVALTFAVLGTALYKVKEARMVNDDRDLLRRYEAAIARHLAEASGPLDQGRLHHRLDDLRLIHPELRVVVGARPVDAEEDDGQRYEVLDLRLTGTDQSMADLRLMLPTATRQQILDRYVYIILGGSFVGVLTSIALSRIAIRRWGRRLRRLSGEARQAAGGSRISSTHVDTELIELVEAFNGTVDRLEQARRQSENFSADVAHELRSPLATLIGGTQLALSRSRAVEELEEALASNLEELERLKTLVNDMLFLARADQGERAQRLESADLGRLADTTIDYCGALLDEAGLVAVRRGEAEAVCNEALIRRAMANLLSNAIQHCDGSKPIELRVETLPGRVRLWVFNSGAPLPGEVVSRMFDRFFRANEARSDRGVHHGLGLSIVQAVARMHGGRVFAERGCDGNAIGLEIPRAPQA